MLRVIYALPDHHGRWHGAGIVREWNPALS